MLKRLILLSLFLIVCCCQPSFACNGYSGKAPETDVLDVVSDILTAPCKLLETAITGLGAPLGGLLSGPPQAQAQMRAPKSSYGTPESKSPKKTRPSVEEKTAPEATVPTPPTPERRVAPSKPPTFQPSPKPQVAPKPTAPPETVSEPRKRGPAPEEDIEPEDSTERRTPRPEIEAEMDRESSESKPPIIEPYSSRTAPAPQPRKRRKARPCPYRKPPCGLYWY